MKLSPALALTAVLFASPVALALDCNNQQTTADFNQCAELDFDAADANLNAAWPNVLNYFEDIDAELSQNSTPAPFKAVDRIIDAQLAWINLRDNDCLAVASHYKGGTLYVSSLVNCKAERTNDRIAQLGRLTSGVDAEDQSSASDEFAYIRSNLSECKPGRGTVGWKFCVGTIFGVADDKLNAKYALTKSSLQGNDEAVELLTNAELAWIKMRDADCSAATVIAWRGTGYTGFGATCGALSSLERKDQLQSMIFNP